MVFSDLFFLFVFLPLFMLVYLSAAAIDKSLRRGDEACNRFRNIALVVFSLVFYAWGEPVYVFLMLVCVFVNYLFGRLIDSNTTWRRGALGLAVAFNVLVLCNFKYLGFFADVLGDMGISVAVPAFALPIGISFYTFQSISYLVDVYRRDSVAQRRFVDLLLYVSMFPQLVAGPIVRYGTVAGEISGRRVSLRDFSEGTYRFLIGLGKKVIIANQLSELSGTLLDGDLSQMSTSAAWVGIAAFTLQIYYDFSGYSDMAIGMGRCLGFHFAENFNHPYCCRTITDFWRRWHISLGGFFRDYVYIPMGGNRRHQALNIMVVWFLTGMWHGASWNFIIWGLYFGVIVMLEKYTLMRFGRHIPSFLLHVYSIFIVVTGWGIFYFDDFGRMIQFFHAYFGSSAALSDFVSLNALTDYFWLWVAAVMFCMPLRARASALSARCFGRFAVVSTGLRFTVRLALSLIILVLSVALLVGATNNAFIYTRF